MYLVDITEKEPEAIRKFLKLSFIAEGFFGSLGLIPSFSWYLLEIKTDRLVDSMSGEIDILAGRLNWSDPKAIESFQLEEAKSEPELPPACHYYLAALRLAVSGGIKWPPLVDYLIGIEAKCAYLHPQANQISVDTIKSKKSSPQKVHRIRLEVERMIQMGCNKVALLDIIVNPPASGINGQAWLQASTIATTSMDAMFPILQNRLPVDSPSGHWVWPIGAVSGGDETRRGASSLIPLRIADDNPFLRNPKIQLQRQEMEKKLRLLFAKLPTPCSFPVIFIDCGACGKIHGNGDVCTNIAQATEI